jgi:hypothetical protein
MQGVPAHAPSPSRRKVAARLLAAVALLAVGTSALVAGETVHHRDAVLVNLTEDDLNRMLVDAFLANGGPRFEGNRERVSRSVADLHYQADLSEPVLQLGAGGLALLSFDVLEADLTIGSIERKVIGRRARCENAGAVIDADHPLDVTVALNVGIIDGALRVDADSVTMADPRKHIRLVKPTVCRNLLLPKWFVWWLGKPSLRRRLDGLDEVLLARARKSVDDLNDEEGLLRDDWEFENERLLLYPSFVDTSRGSLFVSLSGTTGADTPVDGAPRDPIGPLAERSFVGLSDPFLRSLLGLAFADVERRPRAPRGNLRKLFRSEGIFTLVPGLRDLEPEGELTLSFHFGAPPLIEFDRVPAGRPPAATGPEAPGERTERAIVRVLLSDLEMKLWHAGGKELLGTARIDEARIGLLPYLNVIGGVSFELLENDWALSSSGVEFNEELLGATLQELVFGEVFETRYDPLGTDLFHVGKSDFRPTYFDLIDDYLIIELAHY